MTEEEKLMEENRENLLKQIIRNRYAIAQLEKDNDVLFDKLNHVERDSCQWLTVRKAAEMLDVNVCTLYNRINKGKLNVKHIGSKTFVKKSEVLAIDDKYEIRSARY